ncbi:MAG: nucleotidyltransferase family protein [Gammaproteobacteria bacterium]|nr:nucleotidyltransferase family protein [Gammaproteobacteria bacterium]
MISIRPSRIEFIELICGLIREPSLLLQLGDTECDMALRLARRAKLLGYLGARLFDQPGYAKLPFAARDQLESALAVAHARARIARWEMNRIARALSDIDVPLVALKGCAYLLKNLPNVPGRNFADVDLLVPEQDLARVESALVQRGWRGAPLSAHDQKFYRLWTHEIPPLVHTDREVEVDIHFRILPRRGRLTPPAEPLLESAQPVDGSPFKVLSDVDMVLHAMAHLMVSDDLADSLRDLVDVHLLFGFFARADATFWKRFCDRAGALGLVHPAWYSLRYCQGWLGTELPAAAEEALTGFRPNPAARVLMDLLVPEALFPSDPDRQALKTAMCRWLLAARASWIRLPPHLWIWHTGHKVTRQSGLGKWFGR